MTRPFLVTVVAVAGLVGTTQASTPRSAAPHAVSPAGTGRPCNRRRSAPLDRPRPATRHVRCAGAPVVSAPSRIAGAFAAAAVGDETVAAWSEHRRGGAARLRVARL